MEVTLQLPARWSLGQVSTTPDWGVLYDAHADRVFRLLHRLVGDPELAADLVHDTFVRVHERGDEFRGSADAMVGWLFRIAANLGYDALRRRRFQLPDLLDVAALPGDPELRISLQWALDRLDPDERAVVLLHDVDGYRHAEIAEMLGIREGSSRSRLSRARASLRAMLTTEEGDPR